MTLHLIPNNGTEGPYNAGLTSEQASEIYRNYVSPLVQSRDAGVSSVL